MKIVACNSNRPMSEAIAAYLNLPMTKASVRRFSDMECFVEIQENVRGEDVFIIHPAAEEPVEGPIGHPNAARPFATHSAEVVVVVALLLE